MTINSKQNCISDLCASILRTASWRRALQAKYINDPRNGRAAETLFRLADEAVNLSDEQWAELQPFYSWASQTWCEAVSKAARHVEWGDHGPSIELRNGSNSEVPISFC